MQTFLITVTAVLVLAVLILSMRTLKDGRKKKEFTNTYLLENKAFGRCLRIKDAAYVDDTPIILYDSHNWECCTWQVIGIDGDEVFLKNLYSQKAFQPTALDDGAGLVQRNLGGEPLQHWILERVAESEYRIKSKYAPLYLTGMGAENNVPVVLKADDGSDAQVWKATRQNPVV